MITIKRNFEAEDRILQQVTDFINFDSNRKEDKKATVHVSSLLWCLRQSYYKTANPQRLTIYEILRFFKGKISEYAIGRFVYTDEHYLQQEKIEEDDMVAHPDVLSHEQDLVVELKQTDKEFGFVDPRDEMYNSFISYATQLLYYMYLSKKKTGTVLVNHGNYEKILKLINRDKVQDRDFNPFRHWDIEVEEEDFKDIGEDIHFKKELLEKAIEKSNVAYIPKLVTIDMSSTSKCNKCTYRNQCDSEPDYWERLKYDRMMRDRSARFGIPIEQLTLIEQDYKEFKEDYTEAEMPQTATSYLFKSLKKEGKMQFGDLGKHYKVEFKKKK